MIKKSLSVLLVLGLVVGSASSVFSLRLPDPNQNVVDDLRPPTCKKASPWQDKPSNDVFNAFVSYDEMVVFPIFGTLVFKCRAKLLCQERKSGRKSDQQSCEVRMITH